MARPIRYLRIALPHADLTATAPYVVHESDMLDLIYTLFANAMHINGRGPYPHPTLHQLRQITFVSGNDPATGDIEAFTDEGASLHFKADDDCTVAMISCIKGRTDFMPPEHLAQMLRPWARRALHLHLTSGMLACSPHTLIAMLPLPLHTQHLSISFPPIYEGDIAPLTRNQGADPPNSMMARRIWWVQQMLRALWEGSEGNTIVEIIGAWAKWSPEPGDHPQVVEPGWDGLYRKAGVNLAAVPPDDLYCNEFMSRLFDRGWYVVGDRLVKKHVLSHYNTYPNICAAVDNLTTTPDSPVADQPSITASKLERLREQGEMDRRYNLNGIANPASNENDGSIYVTFRPVHAWNSCPACGHLYCSVNPLSVSANVLNGTGSSEPQAQVILLKFDPAAPEMLCT